MHGNKIIQSTNDIENHWSGTFFQINQTFYADAIKNKYYFYENKFNAARLFHV